MKIKKIFLLVISLYFSLISCSKNQKKNLNDLNLDTIVSGELDPCECNKKSIILIESATNVRKKFSKLSELKSDKSAKESIRKIAETYSKLLEKCFTKNASKLFIPSDCNNLDMIEKKQNELLSLGIKINQGSKVWK